MSPFFKGFLQTSCKDCSVIRRLCDNPMVSGSKQNSARDSPSVEKVSLQFKAYDSQRLVVLRGRIKTLLSNHGVLLS